MIAVEFDSYDTNKKIIDACIEKGVFTDWFLFASHALRIAPPLNISEQDIVKACSGIIGALQEYKG
jgi:acetylornithine/succinyldiaminopimelate/putrescine aminotransferase